MHAGVEYWNGACNRANSSSHGWFIEATATNLTPGRISSHMVPAGATTASNAPVYSGRAAVSWNTGTETGISKAFLRIFIHLVLFIGY